MRASLFATMLASMLFGSVFSARAAGVLKINEPGGTFRSLKDKDGDWRASPLPPTKKVWVDGTFVVQNGRRIWVSGHWVEVPNEETRTIVVTQASPSTRTIVVRGNQVESVSTSEEVYTYPAEATVVTRGDETTVIVRTEPPALRVETRTACPSSRHAWIPGHWKYDRRRYVWQSGVWQRRPDGVTTWVPSSWKRVRSGWEYVPGYWQRQTVATTTQTTTVITDGNGTVIITQAPPEPLVEVRTVCPGTGYVWTPGYWTWSSNRYVWSKGCWRRPPVVGSSWVRHNWTRRDRGWCLSDGYWRRPTTTYTRSVNPYGSSTVVRRYSNGSTSTTIVKQYGSSLHVHPPQRRHSVTRRHYSTRRGHRTSPCSPRSKHSSGINFTFRFD